MVGNSVRGDGKETRLWEVFFHHTIWYEFDLGVGDAA